MRAANILPSGKAEMLLIVAVGGVRRLGRVVLSYISRMIPILTPTVTVSNHIIDVSACHHLKNMGAYKDLLQLMEERKASKSKILKSTP